MCCHNENVYAPVLEAGDLYKNLPTITFMLAKNEAINCLKFYTRIVYLITLAGKIGLLLTIL